MHRGKARVRRSPRTLERWLRILGALAMLAFVTTLALEALLMWRPAFFKRHAWSSFARSRRQGVTASPFLHPRVVWPARESDAVGRDDPVSEDQDPQRGHVASCSPELVHLNASIDNPSRFHAYVSDLAPLRAPIMRDQDMRLCEATNADHMGAKYCLPIRAGRSDLPYCEAPNRLDLLAGPISTVMTQIGDTICTGSVLHMLLMDVYETLEQLAVRPVLLFATLREALEMEAIAPTARRASVGLLGAVDAERSHSSRLPTVMMEKVAHTLRRQGYHTFRDTRWHVCIAPTHPLAGQLYNGSVAAQRDQIDGALSVLVDLFDIRRENNTHVVVQVPALAQAEASTSRMDRYELEVHRDILEPTSNVRISGLPLHAPAKPIEMLKMMDTVKDLERAST